MFNWCLAIFIVIGFFLRALALFNDIDYDEAYTFLTYAAKPWLVAIGMYNLPNNHLLNSLLIWFVNHVLGGEPWWIRLPQFLSWAMMAYQLFEFLQKKFSKDLALMVVAALACSYSFVHYGALARGYGLHALLILNCWFLLEAELKGDLNHNWLLPLMMALSFWVLPTSVYPISALFAYWLWEKPTNIKRIFNTGLYGALITICLYSPAILYVLLNGTKSAKEDGIITSVGSLATYLWKMVVYFVDSVTFVPAAILACLFLAFPFIFWKKDRAMARLWLSLVLVPWLVIIATQIVPPFNRVWFWMGPFFFVFAFLSLQEVCRLFEWQRWLPKALASFLVLLSLWVSGKIVWSEWNQRSSSAKLVSEELKKHISPGDFIGFYQGYLTNLEYWEYLKPQSSLAMKRYPIAGNWRFSLERLHAEPKILRKDLAQMDSVKVWSYLNSENSNPELLILVQQELPGWKISLSNEIIVVGNSKFAAFLLEKSN